MISNIGWTAVRSNLLPIFPHAFTLFNYSYIYYSDFSHSKQRDLSSLTKSEMELSHFSYTTIKLLISLFKTINNSSKDRKQPCSRIFKRNNSINNGIVNTVSLMIERNGWWKKRCNHNGVANKSLHRR